MGDHTAAQWKETDWGYFCCVYQKEILQINTKGHYIQTESFDAGMMLIIWLTNSNIQNSTFLNFNISIAIMNQQHEWCLFFFQQLLNKNK